MLDGWYKLTDEEWREFQSIPDQGYSHRAWVDWKIADRVNFALTMYIMDSEEEQ